MSQIFLDSKLNNLAIDGEWREIFKKETPYKFISKKYAEKLKLEGQEMNMLPKTSRLPF